MVADTHLRVEPGGLLQWDELDMLNYHQVLTAAGSSVDAKSTHLDQLFERVRKVHDHR